MAYKHGLGSFCSVSMFSCNYFVAVFIFQPEEKMKFDSIFDSLGPVGGMLSGDKVKPVLLNSKLPVDILGRVGSTRMLSVYLQGWTLTER